MDIHSLYCQHSIAFAVALNQNCPYLTYDDDFDAVISNAFLHPQNCMDRQVAVVEVLVAIATFISMKNDQLMMRPANVQDKFVIAILHRRQQKIRDFFTYI